MISCYYQLRLSVIRLSVIGYQVIGKEQAVACYLKLPITDYRLPITLNNHNLYPTGV
ncbi:MAG: hypothetical protein AB1414_21500 [bacterium]